MKLNIEKYISSGILEQYVLDQLSEVERSEVDFFANIYSDVAFEISEIERTLSNFAKSLAQRPRTSLLPRIMERIALIARYN